MACIAIFQKQGDFIMSRVLITGGAGFIGSNLASRLLKEKHEITIFDNMSRSGCKSNIKYLEDTFGKNSFRLVRADITDFKRLKEATQGAERIYHLAGQVAVTTSVQNPRQDFMDNALGTFNALRLPAYQEIIPYSFIPVPIKYMAVWRTWELLKEITAMNIRICLPAYLKHSVLIFTHPTDAQKEREISIPEIMPVYMDLRPSY